MFICLSAMGEEPVAGDLDDNARPGLATPLPSPGTDWWWRTRQEEMEHEAVVRRDDVERAVRTRRKAIAAAAEAGQLERLASARHLALAASLLRRDQRQRELRLISAPMEGEAMAAMAVLSRAAWRASRERRKAPRVGPLLAVVAGMAMDLRMRRQDLLGESSNGAQALREAAAEVGTLGLARAAATAATVAAKAELSRSQLAWMEAERRRAAVAGRVAHLAASLSQAQAMALPPPVPAGGRADHKREIELEHRLPHGLLRLAGEADRMARSASRRWLGSPSVAISWMFRLSDIPFLAPIAGLVEAAHVPPAGRGAPGFLITAAISQAVSSPVSGRVMFAERFRGFGQLLIIDCGRGYHVLLWGLTQLDVDRGASVVAGQAIGEIVAARKRSIRLFVELRRRGVPVEPDSWQMAREGKVRS